MTHTILIAVMCLPALAVTDFAPHNMTSNTSPSPYVVTVYTYYGGGWEGWRVFDGGNGMWYGGSGYPVQQSIAIDIGAWHTLGSYAIKSSTDGLNDSSAWQVYGSGNGSIWDLLDTQSGITWSSAGQTQTFTISSPSYSYRQFKLQNVTSSGGGWRFTELYLYDAASTMPNYPNSDPEIAPHNMTGPSAPSPFVAAGISSYYNNPSQGFDGGVDACQSSSNAFLTSNTPAWLSIDLGSGNAKYPTYYQLIADSVDSLNRALKTWQFQGSNDNSTWTTLDTQTNVSAWAVCERRWYKLSTVTTAYRYFRIYATATQSDPFYSIPELWIMGTVAPPASAKAQGIILW